MSTHKQHLHTEPLSPEVITVIQGLQAWLREAKFEVFSVGLGKAWIQHLVCTSVDRYEKWDSIAEKLSVDIEVVYFDSGHRNNRLMS